MGVGEYISVSSQLDTEKADIEKEVEAHATASGRAHELEELAQIYVARGLDYELARQVSCFAPRFPFGFSLNVLFPDAVRTVPKRPFCTLPFTLLTAPKCLHFAAETLSRSATFW